jgi:branched-chain amino acid transport system substrate-binding protein
MLRSAGMAGALAATWLSTALPGAAADVTIGLAVPLSGRMAPVGLAMKRSVEAAVTEANAAGGVLGQRLVLATEEDGCANATAQGAAIALLTVKPALILGHPCSNAAIAAQPHYAQAGVLLMAVGPRHPDVTRPGSSAGTLRLAGRDDRQGAAAAAWLLDNAPNRRMAIVHDRTSYARGIVDGVLATLKAADVDPIALVPIVAGKQDYEAVARMLRERGAEDVLFAGYPDEAAIIVSAIDKLALAIPLIGSDALATPDFARFSAKAQTRVQVLVPAERDLDGIDDEAVAQGARARGGVEAWITTAQRLGTTEGGAIAAALRGARVMTRAAGEISFDLNGDLDIPSFAPASARAGRWTRGD